MPGPAAEAERWNVVILPNGGSYAAIQISSDAGVVMKETSLGALSPAFCALRTLFDGRKLAHA